MQHVDSGNSCFALVYVITPGEMLDSALTMCIQQTHAGENIYLPPSACSIQRVSDLVSFDEIHC
jgi:hypothetical protein